MQTRPTWNDSLNGCLSRKETGMAAPTGVEEYLAALPEESRAALEKLRKTIKAAAPEATETISYQMPAFKDQGRFLVPTPRSRTTAASSPRAMRSSRHWGKS